MFNTGAFLAYILEMSFTPGPNNIMSMNNARRLGFRRGFSFNMGILAGFLLVASLCTLVSTALEALIPKIQLAMKFFGAAYMIYLAYKTIRPAADYEKESAQRGFLSGALLQFVNPKLYVYCFTSMSVYILPHFDAFWQLMGFTALLAFTGFASTVCWALFGSAFKSFFSGRNKIVNAAMALLLLYCAVMVFL